MKEKNLPLDELEQATGGNNAFADVLRVPQHEIDDFLREKI